MGFIAIILLNQILYNNHPFLTVSLVTLSGISTLLLLIVYLHLNLFVHLGQRIKHIKQWTQKWEIDKFTHNANGVILMWAFLRYAVYLIQYLIVIEILGFEIGLTEKFGVVGIIFMLQSVVILPSLMGFVARVEIAFFVWSIVGIIKEEILIATLFLWVVNLALPAFLGSIWLLINRNKNDEKLI